MGLCFGAIGTLTLELSDPQDQGANVAALQVCDSSGSVLFIGVAGADLRAALAGGTVTARTFTTIWLLAVIAPPIAGGRSAVLAARRSARPR